LDRRNSLHVLLVNLPLTSLPGALVRLGLCSLLRVLLLMVRGQVHRSLDELLAALAVLGRPDRVLAGRVTRRRTRRVGARSVTSLLASRASGAGHTLDTLAGLLGIGEPRASGEVMDRDAVPVLNPDAVTDLRSVHRVMDLREGPPGAPSAPGVPRLRPPSAPSAARPYVPPATARTLALRCLLRPGALAVGALSVLALLAGRDLLGPGRLAGGALLPAPDGAYGLWRTALASWHPIGRGSPAMAPPDVAALAALSLPLLGSVDRLVDFLLIGGVPLCGAAAWLLLRQLTANRWLCAWGAVTYALLPAVTGAIAAGRLGAVVLAICVPLIALGGTRALTRGWGGASALSAAFRTGAALALATAFEPVSYLLAVLVAFVVAVLAVRGWGLTRLAVVLAVPPAVLLPMTLAVVADPGMLLRARGLPVAAGTAAGGGTPGLEQLGLLLLDPGGLGGLGGLGARPWWWVATGVVMLGALGFVRGGRCLGVRVAGGVAVAGLAAAQVLPHLLADLRLGAGPVWAGPALLVAGFALVNCAVLGAADVLRYWRASRIGSGRALIALVVVAAASAPLLAAAQWSTRGTGELGRVESDLLPAYVVHDASSGGRARTVVISSDAAAGGALRATLLRDRGPQLGDADLATTDSAPAGLAAAVGLLASGSGNVGSGDVGSGTGDPGPLALLRGFGVGYLLLARPVDPALASAIDAEPGLTRVSSPNGDALWRMDRPGVRARVLAADGTDLASVDAGEVGVDTALESGPRGRRLILAETADPGWRATIDGVPLQASTQGWAQAFALPPSGGRLVVRHVNEERDMLVLGQGALAILVLLAALPGTRRDPQRTGIEAG
jgi:hypothetical protein